MADESRYVAKLPLVPAQTAQDFGRTDDACPKVEGIGEIVEIPLRGIDVAQRAQSIERAAFWRWRENRYWAPSISDLDRFAVFDASQQLAGALPQLPHPNGCHVLLIAQFGRRTVRSSSAQRSRPFA